MGGGGGAIAYRHNGYQVRASRGWHNEIMNLRTGLMNVIKPLQSK
jgi:hypothetical protein